MKRQIKETKKKQRNLQNKNRIYNNKVAVDSNSKLLTATKAVKENEKKESFTPAL